ncbi:MAG: RidA family protein [Firmicutes bacterium]|nr:RidA family protein [Bacillota bacterium]MBQ6013659.1 RidA family protein [Bacillota bacterium]MBQ6260896.1 RidA family protein [Bacillota bacterium]MBR0113677.1 RidA family protein [Bacillota bacterium]
MKIQRFDSNGRMHAAVIAGETLYLTGVTAPGVEGITAQATLVLKKIEGLLDKYGSDKEHILQALIYLKDMKDFSEFNQVWDAWVVEGTQPTRACLQASMATEKHLVEIVITAAVKES